MKKFFVISGLVVAALVVVSFTSCGNNNTVTTVTPPQTVSATPIPSENPTPTPAVSVSTTAAEVKSQVYTNTKFGYQITLPAGYKALVESRPSQPYPQDKIVIRDASGQEFATIYTPMLETGAEVWEPVEEKDLPVPGSATVLHTWKGKPTAEAQVDDWIYWVTWRGADNDFQKTGLIMFSYLPDQTVKLKNFESMINSLRFL